jgi:DNA-binding NtrC family response regulator
MAVMDAKNQCNVLCVDDSAVTLAAMEQALSGFFHVRTTTSAPVALRLLDRDRYHVVCADWELYGSSGIELFRAIAKKELELTPCFILVMAQTEKLMDPSFEVDRKTLGILRKPYASSELIERVHQFAGLAKLKESSSKLRAALKEEGSG